MIIDIQSIIRRAREFRREVLHVSQTDVAKATGYSQQNISKWELGLTDNQEILCWYISQGFSVFPGRRDR